MFKFARRVMKELGFSLIELMVVIAIVAVLAAVAVPSYKSSVIAARSASAPTRITIEQELERWVIGKSTGEGYANRGHVANQAAVTPYFDSIFDGSYSTPPYEGLSFQFDGPIYELDPVLDDSGRVEFYATDNNGVYSWTCAVFNAPAYPSTPGLLLFGKC
jgi:prepilin-type N-terminal cleavage/methylation domain-containing protein